MAAACKRAGAAVAEPAVAPSVVPDLADLTRLSDLADPTLARLAVWAVLLLAAMGRAAWLARRDAEGGDR